MDCCYDFSTLSSSIDDFQSINDQFLNDLFVEDHQEHKQQKEQIFHHDETSKKTVIHKKKPIYKPHCKWSKEEDEKLKELVKEFGEKDWRHLAKKFEGRNSRQCRERWNYYLNPILKQGQWTIEEDRMILEKYQEQGPRWIEITKYFEHRTDAMIKNRFNYLIRKQKRLREGNEFPIFLSNSKNVENEMTNKPLIKNIQDSEFNISFDENSYSFDSNEDEYYSFQNFEFGSFLI